MDRKIQSADGSQTYYSSLFKECYHSLKDGAFTETMHKHILPPLLFGDVLQQAKIRILDICFGLGYNSFASAWTYKTHSYNGKLEILSPEIDNSVFEKIQCIDYPKEWDYLQIREKITYLKSQKQVSLDTNTTLKVVIKDAFLFLDALEDLSIDIIYQDAFSLKSTPKFWERDFFVTLYRILAPNGMITTYVTHKNVYEIAKSVGFRVYKYQNNFCRKSTIFTKNLILEHPNLYLES